MGPAGDKVVHVLWTNAGLSCDGDSVSLTNATLPAIEEIATGALPGIPKVQFHWPLIDYQVGDEFMQWFFKADAGQLDPFVLVVEGSIPNERIKSEGYWTGFGNNPQTGQPITVNEWIDRLAPKATAIIAAGTCATYGGIHAMERQPDRRDGSPRLPRLELEVEGRAPYRLRAGVPRTARQHGGDASLPPAPVGRKRADDPAGRQAQAEVAVR